MAVRAGRGDAAAVRHADPDRRDPRAVSTRAASSAGDIVGIGIHTGNALRGYEIGVAARAAGALRGVTAASTRRCIPDEARDLGGAHAVVTGDGERAWPLALRDCVGGRARVASTTAAGSRATSSCPADGICCRQARYMWASVQTVRGCPKHCSFCSVWRTDGQRPRQRHVDAVLDEIVELRRRGFRFIALADDNFYPVTLEDLRMAARRQDQGAARAAAGDPRRAVRADGRRWRSCRPTRCSSRRSRWKPPRIRSSSTRCAARTSRARSSASKSVTPEGLKDIYKDFNESGEALVERLRAFRAARRPRARARSSSGCRAIAPRRSTRRLSVAERAGLTFAQFVMLTPFPGTLDFAAWEKSLGAGAAERRRHPGHAPLADSAGAAARRSTWTTR